MCVIVGGNWDDSPMITIPSEQHNSNSRGGGESKSHSLSLSSPCSAAREKEELIQSMRGIASSPSFFRALSKLDQLGPVFYDGISTPSLCSDPRSVPTTRVLT